MSDPIDTKIVSRLAAILKMNDLAELEYETETCRISLIKSHAPLPPAPAPFTPAPAPVPAAPAVAAETPAVAAPAADNAADVIAAVQTANRKGLAHNAARYRCSGRHRLPD